MRQKKQLILTFLASSVIALGGIGFLIYEQSKEAQQKKITEESNQSDLKLAEFHLNQGKPFEALKLAKKHHEELFKENAFKEAWLKMTISSANRIGDADFLTELYESTPTAFNDQEEAILKIASNYLNQQKKENFKRLREEWQDKTAFPERWQLLEIDQLALEGDFKQCRELLKKERWSKHFEVERLTRLALLSINEHPKVAFDYLSKALRLEPDNLDLHLYRAHLLKASEKEALAIEELKTLVDRFPNEPLIQEELAELYLREKNEKAAFALYQANLNPNSSDTLWFKAFFLNRVINPIDFNFTFYQIPAGPLNPLIQYLADHPDKYWDLEKNSPLNIFAHFEEAFWLKTIELLKVGKEFEAFEFLIKSKEENLYKPGLKTALLKALQLRHPELQSEALAFDTTSLKHPLFTQLNTLNLNEEVQHLLTGNDAFSALFLAAGWNEAALYLKDSKNLDKNLPSWFIFGITQAYAKNRNVESAIQFANQQKQTPQLALLVGELYLKTDYAEFGYAMLKQLAAFETPVGSRAAEVLTRDYLKKAEFAKAREALGLNKTFFQTNEGQKLLATVSLTTGDLMTAEAIFGRMESSSLEAKSYLANKAFQNRDYHLAYQLTLELLKENPENGELRENLKKIALSAKG